MEIGISGGGLFNTFELLPTNLPTFTLNVTKIFQHFIQKA